MSGLKNFLYFRFDNSSAQGSLRFISSSCNFFEKVEIDGNDLFKSQTKDSVIEDDMPIEIENPFIKERKVCILCKHDIKVDYKNAKLLSQFISPFTGQVYERHITRLCKKQHDLLKTTVKQSIQGGYMGAMLKNVEFLKDPQLFDPNNPIRPHKY